MFDNITIWFPDIVCWTSKNLRTNRHRTTGMSKMKWSPSCSTKYIKKVKQTSYQIGGVSDNLSNRWRGARLVAHLHILSPFDSEFYSGKVGLKDGPKNKVLRTFLDIVSLVFPEFWHEKRPIYMIQHWIIKKKKRGWIRAKNEAFLEMYHHLSDFYYA